MSVWRQRAHKISAAWRERGPGGLLHLAYRWLSRRRIPLLSAFARYRTAPSPRQRFVLQARAALDDFLLSGARLTLPADPSPRVTALILVHDRPALTYRCLASLAAQDRSVPLTVLIVDNASGPLTRSLLARVDGATVLRQEENLGFLRGCNEGLERVETECLLLLNNDTEVPPGSVRAALETLDGDPRIGAVGARIVLPDGTLQEAGGIIWRDGSCRGYGRGLPAHQPECMWRRDVDYSSAAFLLTRTALLRQAGGFDERYLPAYYEDADYCVWLARNGHRVVYDPRATVLHYEFGSSPGRGAHFDRMRTNQRRFADKHREWLETRRPPEGGTLEARTAGPGRRRILVVDDRVPHSWWGAGFTRSNRVVQLLAGWGWQVTVYTTAAADGSWAETYRDLPLEVEVIPAASTHGLGSWLERRRSYYDVVWVSRPHNMAHLAERCAELLRNRSFRLVYDAEAIFSEREALERQVTGRDPRRSQELGEKREMALGAAADAIVSVKEADAERWRRSAGRPTFVVGLEAETRPGPADPELRSGILFVGAMHSLTSPNADSLEWFLEEVLPRLREPLGPVEVTAVGYAEEDVRRHFEDGYPALRLRGRVESLAPHFDAARLVVIPTRYASGLPQKAYDAAAAGVPAVCTGLIARQLGWQNGEECLTAPAGDAGAFADCCVRLYQDQELWLHLRRRALAYMAERTGGGGIAADLRAVLEAMGLPDDAPGVSRDREKGVRAGRESAVRPSRA